MDETGLSLGTADTNPYVLGAAGALKGKTVKKSPAGREWVSIVKTVSAEGRALRPCVIFKGGNLQSTWFPTDHVPPWRYKASENGWTDNETAIAWLNDIFLPETQSLPQRPRLLIMDGHKTHCSLEFMLQAHQAGLYLLFLPAHSSHVTQPLDYTCFSPIKHRYRAQISALTAFDDGAPIKKIQFIQYYAKARAEGLTSQIIKNGFRAAGIHPFNPQKTINNPLAKPQGPRTPGPRPSLQKPTILGPQTPHRRTRASIYPTPTNARQFTASLSALKQAHLLTSPIKSFLTKVEKGFNVAATQQAFATNQAAGVLAKLNAIRDSQKKGRVRVQVDPNTQFASINQIMEAKAEEIKRQAEYADKHAGIHLEQTSKTMKALQMEDFLFEFQI